MFCENCGSPLGETDKFCNKCGCRVSEVKQVNVLEEAAAWPQNPEMSENAQKAAARPSFFRRHMGKLIAVVIVAAVSITAAVNASAISNMVRKTFSTPKQYYQYVEKKAITDTTQRMAENYQRYFKGEQNAEDTERIAALEFELTEQGRDLLGLGVLEDMDLPKLESGSLKFSYLKKDDLMRGRALASLNGKNLGEADILLDYAKQMLYFALPKHNQTWMGIDFGALIEDEMSMSEYEEAMGQMEALKEACPDQKTFRKILNRYMEVVLNGIEDVEKAEETIKAEGVIQKCTALKVTFDEDGLKDIVKRLYIELSKDKEMKQIFLDIAEVMAPEEDGEDLYDELLSDMEDSITDWSLEWDSSAELVMTIYVDRNGEIRGRRLEASSEYSKTEITSIMPKRGSKFGYELSVSENGTNASVTGSGKESGNKLSGAFELQVNGMSIFDITVKELDIKKAEQGQLNGSMTIAPSGQLSSLLRMAIASEQASGDRGSLLENLQMKLDMKSSEEKAAIELSFLYEEERLGGFVLRMENGKAGDIKMPEDVMMVEGEEELDEWLQDFDWDVLKDDLEAVGFPPSITERIEDLKDELAGNAGGGLWE